MIFPFGKRIIYASQRHSQRFCFFFRTYRREAEERRGAVAGNESLLCEERDRARSEAGAEEQRPPTGLAVERTGCATQIAAEMRWQLVYLPYATDIAVADTDPLNATLLLGLVSRTGQT